MQPGMSSAHPAAQSSEWALQNKQLELMRLKQQNQQIAQAVMAPGGQMPASAPQLGLGAGGFAGTGLPPVSAAGPGGLDPLVAAVTGQVNFIT